MGRDGPAEVARRCRTVEPHIDAHLTADGDELERIQSAADRFGVHAVLGVDAAPAVTEQKDARPFGIVRQVCLIALTHKQRPAREPEFLIAPPLRLDPLAVGLGDRDAEPAAATVAAPGAIVALRPRRNIQFQFFAQ